MFSENYFNKVLGCLLYGAQKVKIDEDFLKILFPYPILREDHKRFDKITKRIKKIVDYQGSGIWDQDPYFHYGVWRFKRKG